MRGKVLCAWLAALIDGEGSIMILERHGKAKRRKAHHFRVSVAVSNTDIRLMNALVKETGVRRVYLHVRPPKRRHVRTAYTWRLASEDIRIWVPRVLPFLVCKRRQAELLMEYMELARLDTPVKGKKHGPYTGMVRKLAIRQEITRLNRKGCVANDEIKL